MNSHDWDEMYKFCDLRWPLLFSATIDGQFPSGKNNYRLTPNGIIKDKIVRQYEKNFSSQIFPPKFKWKIKKPIEDNVLLMAKVVYHSFKRDVDTILLCDLLQKCEILKNDRQIKVKLINGVDIDEKKPLVSFCIFKI